MTESATKGPPANVKWKELTDKENLKDSQSFWLFFHQSVEADAKQKRHWAKCSFCGEVMSGRRDQCVRHFERLGGTTKSYCKKVTFDDAEVYLDFVRPTKNLHESALATTVSEYRKLSENPKIDVIDIETPTANIRSVDSGIGNTSRSSFLSLNLT